MCGIAGIISREVLSEEEHAALRRMVRLLAHRGPDDERAFHARHAALGHRRLAIVDRENGHQPLANEDLTVIAVLNGEIYNYRELREELRAGGHFLQSQGDSECLVHLFEESGPSAVTQLNGMFAFAVWNEQTREAVLARDRLGVKPLYYYEDGERLIFASELKTILAAPDVPRDIDPFAMSDYLTFGFIPSPRTIFRDIHKLPPGHLLYWRDGHAEVRPFWELHHREWSGATPDDLSEELWSRLQEATRVRLVDDDVPFGSFLSGGLDSTSVTAAACGILHRPINTFTCGFEESGFDERSASRKTAALFGSDHREMLVRADAAATAEVLCHHFDEPFADASAIAYYSMCKLARPHMKVALSGDGGDEILAGYRRYRFDQYEQRLRRWAPPGVRRVVFGPLATIYPNRTWMPRPLRASATLRNLSVDGATAHGYSIATLDPRSVRSLLNPDFRRACENYDPLETVRRYYSACDAPDHLSKCQFVDIKMGLADGILTKVDRASMAHGLEVRSPMLDYRFVEFAWSIPPAARIEGLMGKAPLRRALSKRIGAEPAGRRKAGFEVPLDAWIAGPLRGHVEDELIARDSAVGDFLSGIEVRRLWRDHISGRRLRGAVLWKLLMLSTWCRRFSRPLAVRMPSGGRRELACTAES